MDRGHILRRKRSPAADENARTKNFEKYYMSYKPQNEKAEIAFQSGGKILTALTRFE
jgi:DNA/RNA endonuclease G (NUC1)